MFRRVWLHSTTAALTRHKAVFFKYPRPGLKAQCYFWAKIVQGVPKVIPFLRIFAGMCVCVYSTCAGGGMG